MVYEVAVPFAGAVQEYVTAPLVVFTLVAASCRSVLFARGLVIAKGAFEPALEQNAEHPLLCPQAGVQLLGVQAVIVSGTRSEPGSRSSSSTGGLAQRCQLFGSPGWSQTL